MKRTEKFPLPNHDNKRQKFISQCLPQRDSKSLTQTDGIIKALLCRETCFNYQSKFTNDLLKSRGFSGNFISKMSLQDKHEYLNNNQYLTLENPTPETMEAIPETVKYLGLRNPTLDIIKDIPNHVTWLTLKNPTLDIIKAIPNHVESLYLLSSPSEEMRGIIQQKNIQIIGPYA